MVLFSTVGFVSFKIGKRELNMHRIVLGLVLMLYPYFATSGFWLWFVGLLLSCGVFYFHD